MTLIELRVHWKKQTLPLIIFRIHLNQIQAAPQLLFHMEIRHLVQNIAPTTIKKVIQLIKETRDKKSSAFDMISEKILKEFSPKTVKMLAILLVGNSSSYY